MRKLAAAFLGTLLTLGLIPCHAKPAPVIKHAAANDSQDIRIFSVENKNGNITGATIEEAFEKTGLLLTAIMT